MTDPDDLPTHVTGNEDIDPQPGDNTTLTEVIDAYERDGFDVQFEIDASPGEPVLRCGTCEQTSDATEVSMHSVRRLEGASDPDDMLAVAAITCPRCQARGLLVLGFGPTASPEEADVLRMLRDARSDDVEPPASPTDETVVDG